MFIPLLHLHEAPMPFSAQVVMGQTFSGQVFKPTPTQVVFKDFEAGQTYRQHVTVTNISLGRNTFKVLSFPCVILPKHSYLCNLPVFSIRASLH